MANKRTPLYQTHLDCGAKVVDFHGWDMPLHYGSQIQEHNAVRADAGMFDVSHMTIVDVTGSDAKAYLQYLLANDVAKLKQPGKALYSCMLNEQGGVIDDLITYFIKDNVYRLVVNSATREQDLAWMQKQAANYQVTLTEETQCAMIAVQGPNAIAKVSEVVGEAQREVIKNLKPFYGAFVSNTGWFIGYTGYTGEQGLEIILPIKEAAKCWIDLKNAGVQPCGLGARDTLRLEAGMNLYGQDMDQHTSPLTSGLAWTIAWEPSDRDFIGRSALEQQRSHGVAEQLVGLVLLEPGVIRGEQVVITEHGNGVVTSGSFSPTMKKSIAFARIPAEIKDKCYVMIRDKKVAAQVVKLPFVRNGKILISSNAGENYV